MWKVVDLSPEAIEHVMSATKCRKSQARTYLQRSGNDVEQAISLLQSHLAQKRPSDSSLKPQTDSPTPPTRPVSTPALSSPSSTGSLLSVSGTYNENGKPNIPKSPLEPLEESRLSTSTDLVRSRTPISEEKQVSTKNVQISQDLSTWDFGLPSVEPAPTFQLNALDGTEPFSIHNLIGAMQKGAKHEDLKTYLNHFGLSNPQLVSRAMNEAIEGIPVMLYVVAGNNEANIRLFVKHGGDVNTSYGNPPIPLLGYAIINRNILNADTTAAVATLLSLGSSSAAIPRPFYFPFDEELPSSGPADDELKDTWTDETRWCQPPHIRTLLVETLNITERYYLHRSSKISRPTARQRWVAARHDSSELFAVPYFLIGQSAATDLLTRSLLHYMLRRHDQPLVLVFAGPSGHGKTELARRLGALLSLDLQVSDCTIVSREVELFGPRKPYVGAEEGSPLNNFLAAHHDQKCIVFLDEFEKTTADIWNSLLIPFDKGEYQDRRNLKMINCSKTIWILATNALDKRIIDFCEKNNSIFDEDHPNRRQDLLEELTSRMKEDFMGVFKPPLTGRISSIVPFLPFSKPETYVGAHKYLLELGSEVRRPICTKPGPQEQLLGNIRLKIRSDVGVCKVVVKDYDSELGIRSLKKAVRDRVASCLDVEYMAMHEVIKEDLPMEDYSVFVNDGRVKVKRIVPS